MIIFVIIFVIQFVVITKGATRISEVAARFMLDGMPGRQMAIDADLHAGLIDQKQAQQRRENVHRQADFFGAMDGAGKFVRGDAVAGVIITFVNIGAGLFLGIINYHMSFRQAAEVLMKLTIGDGLVSQVPAFLTALAAGLIVTRSSEDSDLGRRSRWSKLLGQPSRAGDCRDFSERYASFTGLPAVPLLRDGAARVGFGAYFVTNSSQPDPAIAEVEDTEKAVAHVEPPSERMEDLLHVDPLELEIGYRLISLADPTRGGDLLDRLRAIRHRVAQDMGLIKFRRFCIRDEIGLGPHDYRLKIRGTVVGQGVVLCRSLAGRPACRIGCTARRPRRFRPRQPASPPSGFMPTAARWPSSAGCRVLEASAVVSGHFGEVVLGHADELMTREQVGRLLDKARATSPALVDEVVPGLLRAGELQQVLQNLLRERVSVRDLETILENTCCAARRQNARRRPADRTRQARTGAADCPGLSRQGRSASRRDAHESCRRLARRHAGEDETTAVDAALGGDAVRDLVRAAVAMAVAPLIEAGSSANRSRSPLRPGQFSKDLTRADFAAVGRRRKPAWKFPATRRLKSAAWSPRKTHRKTLRQRRPPKMWLGRSPGVWLDDEGGNERTYRAGSLKEALAQVRRDLGGDAVILNTREVRGRRLFGLRAREMVEVTASDRPISAIGAEFDQPPVNTPVPAISHTIRTHVGDQLGQLHAMVGDLSRMGQLDHLLPELPASLVPGLRHAA